MNLHLVAAVCVIIAFALYATSAVLGTAFGVLGLVFEAVALVSMMKAIRIKGHKE